MKLSSVILVLILGSSCTADVSRKQPARLSDLAGKWEAEAFDGILSERWELLPDGGMSQEGYYIEGGDTSYSAMTKIVDFGGELILYSVIQNSNPKIFKATTVTEDSIIFENSDYRNPIRVTYELIGQNSYRRTIRGIENDQTVVYQFNFDRTE